MRHCVIQYTVSWTFIFMELQHVYGINSWEGGGGNTLPEVYCTYLNDAALHVTYSRK